MDRGGKGGVQYVQFGLQGGNRWLGTLHIAGIATVAAPTHFTVAIDSGPVRKVIRQRDAPEYQKTTVVTRGTAEAAVGHRHGGVLSENCFGSTDWLIRALILVLRPLCSSGNVAVVRSMFDGKDRAARFSELPMRQ